MVDIRHIRKGLKLSQSEFSKVLGITQGYLSDLENLKQKPGEELLNTILEYAQENNVKIIHISNNEVNEHQVPYHTEKKDLLDALRYDLNADRAIRVNEYIAHGRYKPGNILAMVRHTGIIIFGRPYVIYLKGVQHPVICTVYPEPDNNESIRIKMTDDLPVQTIPRSEISEIYSITHNIETIV